MLIILPFGIISLSNKPGVILTPWYHSRVKLPLLLIGKAKNSVGFVELTNRHCTLRIDARKNAWADTVIFNDCFKNCFVPDVNKKLAQLVQEPKVLLLLHNCSAHHSKYELVSCEGQIGQVSTVLCHFVHTTHGLRCFRVPEKNLS